MYWIKKVEIAKSIDEPTTSRSIVGAYLLDAMIASALKKLLNTHIHFRKRVSVEDQRAQPTDSYVEDKLGNFRATRANEAHEDSQICSR